MSLALRRAEILPMLSPRLSAAWRPEKRRLELEFTGEVTGEAYRDLMLSALGSHPEAAVSDWLYDLRAYSGTVGHADVAAVAAASRALAQGRDERALSVLVTPDPGFVHWAALCRVQFRPRHVEVVANMAEAEAMLGSPAD